MNPIELFKLVDTIKGESSNALIRITFTAETIELDVREITAGRIFIFTRREIEGAAYPVDKVLFAIKKLIKDLNERDT